MRLEIKKEIGYQRIRKFPDLVNSCRIYEEDNKAHYKVMNDRRGKQQQYHGKPYNAPADKVKHIISNGKRTSGGSCFYWCHMLQMQKTWSSK